MRPNSASLTEPMPLHCALSAVRQNANVRRHMPKAIALYVSA